jgi:hypothetical protein
MEYTNGQDTSLFQRVSEISSYNYNYYKNGSDLLLAISDDDTETVWYVKKGLRFIYVGYTSYHNENADLMAGVGESEPT